MYKGLNNQVTQVLGFCPGALRVSGQMTLRMTSAPQFLSFTMSRYAAHLAATLHTVKAYLGSWVLHRCLTEEWQPPSRLSLTQQLVMLTLMLSCSCCMMSSCTPRDRDIPDQIRSKGSINISESG